jgi:hypothetical protein
MTTKKILLAAFLCWLTPAARADNLYCFSGAKGYVFETPKGWIRDEARGKKLGICAVYYPQGTTFDAAPAVMYPNFKTKRAPTQSLKTVMDIDLAPFMRHQGARVNQLGSIKTPVGTWEDVSIDFGPSPNEFERIAYLDGDSVFLIVLSARRRADLDKYVGAYQQAVAGAKLRDVAEVYQFLALEAKTDKAEKGGAAFAAKYMVELGPKLATALKSCVGARKEAPLGLVVQIAETGEAKDFVFSRQGTVPDCLRGKLRGHLGPKPPKAPFHLHHDLKF